MEKKKYKIKESNKIKLNAFYEKISKETENNKTHQNNK